jgi:hypothetical protein
MRTQLSKYLIAVAAVSLMASPGLALAQTSTAASGYDAPAVCPPGATCLKDTLQQGPGSVVELVKKVTNWLFTFLLLLAVMFFVLAGYKYLTSGGGEEVGAAHKMVIYGAVAVAVGALAQGISFVVQKLVGAA